MRETYADMLVAIDDFDTAMLKPGLVAHVQGRRVLALDGFEAALDRQSRQAAHVGLYQAADPGSRSAVARLAAAPTSRRAAQTDRR